MANISKITLSNNNQYDIKDSVARGQIENIQSDLISGITWVDDCNNATENGITYGVTSSAANSPIARAGYIKVKKDLAGNKYQHFSVRGTNFVETYERSKNSSKSTWGAWVKSPTRAQVDALNTDSKYRSGDTITIARNYLIGYIDNSNILHFIIPLSKILANVSGTIGSMSISKLTISQTGTWVDILSVITNKVGYPRQNGIDIEITLSSVALTRGIPTIIDFRGSLTL